MRISDWSSDVWSSDLAAVGADESAEQTRIRVCRVLGRLLAAEEERPLSAIDAFAADAPPHPAECADADGVSHPAPEFRIPEEHAEPPPRQGTPPSRWSAAPATAYPSSSPASPCCAWALRPPPPRAGPPPVPTRTPDPTHKR